jgi:predicted protein tyrosine phosphatase
MAGNITICRADELVDKVAALKPSAVLSIEHPDVKPDESGYAPRLTDGTPQMILNFWDSEIPVPNGPDIEQVEQGMAFIMEHVTKGDVIIHCRAGKARSVAIALGVLSQLYPHENEAALVKKLIALRPQAAPNILVVEMVDKLTGRNGKLLQAVLDNSQITAARIESNIRRDNWHKQNPEKFPPPKP